MAFKSSEWLILIVSVLAILLLVSLAIQRNHPVLNQTNTTLLLSNWTRSTDYPTNIAKQRCVADSGYVYCVGGIDLNVQGAIDVDTNNAFYATVGAGGLGLWISTTPYPVAVRSFGCVAYNHRIYCAGGDFASTGIVAYYANLSSEGIGPWISEPNGTYPLSSGIGLPHLQHYGYASYDGVFYAVGGLSGAQVQHGNVLSNIVSDVHSASIKSGGFGTFASSQPYPIPIAYEKCVQNNGNLYCFGGIGADEEYTTNSYYASLTSNGISSWTQTMSYPENGSDYSCAVIDGDAVCVGGGSRNVYYTGLTANGVSGWKALGGYPLPIGSEECVISGNALCCIGGGTGGLDITNRTYCADIYVLDSAS